MTDLTPERRADLRDMVATSGTYSTCVPGRDLRALLDAADERDRLTAVASCSETHEEPYDFAYCSTHDRTFALGDHCDYAGLSEVGYLEKQGREQRVRALRAEDERDTLAAAVERVRVLAEGWHSRGKHLMAYSKTPEVPDDMADSLLNGGAEFVERARLVRSALDGADDE